MIKLINLNLIMIKLINLNLIMIKLFVKLFLKDKQYSKSTRILSKGTSNGNKNIEKREYLSVNKQRISSVVYIFCYAILYHTQYE